jgi:hypothetical protein
MTQCDALRGLDVHDKATPLERTCKQLMIPTNRDPEVKPSAVGAPPRERNLPIILHQTSAETAARLIQSQKHRASSAVVVWQLEEPHSGNTFPATGTQDAAGQQCTYR